MKRLRLRKCDYCEERFIRKDLRMSFGADILLYSISCEPCAKKHGYIWVKNND